MRSEERKREIINKSIELISRRGLHGFTIKNLSKKVGISEPALYRHFRNKFDILKSILLFFKEDSQNLVDAVKSREVNWCTKIKLFFMGHLERLNTNHAYSTAIFAEDVFNAMIYAIMGAAVALIDSRRCLCAKYNAVFAN